MDTPASELRNGAAADKCSRRGDGHLGIRPLRKRDHVRRYDSEASLGYLLRKTPENAVKPRRIDRSFCNSGLYVWLYIRLPNCRIAHKQEHVRRC